MIGNTISHYRITEKLGAGGMGVVNHAKDPNLNRQVAIKVLPEMFSGDPGRMAHFECEAKLPASLVYPNIAAIHGLEQPESKRFLVLELVEGETRAQRRSKKGAMRVKQ
jgi:serine/threonine protein kinase